jgi:hypothetical protein
LCSFIIDVDFAVGSLHFVDASNVASVSKVHAASIFGVEVNRVKECLCIHIYMRVCVSWPIRPIGGRVGSDTQSNRDRRQGIIIKIGH